MLARGCHVASEPGLWLMWRRHNSESYHHVITYTLKAYLGKRNGFAPLCVQLSDM